MPSDDFVLAGQIEEVKENLITIDIINASLSIINGYVLRPNNSVVSSNGYSYCDYYDISKSVGKAINVSADVYVSTQSAYDSAVILYNSNKVVTRAIKARTIAGTTTSGTYGIDNYEITVQEGEKYIRISSHSTNISLKCIGELRKGLHEVVNEISALNNKIDSLDTVSDVNVQLNVIDGYVLRPNNSVVSSNGYSYCDYYDISKSVGKIIKVTTNAWVSSQAAYDSAVIIYNSSKVPTRTINARTIAGTTTSGMYRVVDYPVTVQDDEKYIRISSKNSSSGGMNLICDGSISDGFAELKLLDQKFDVISEEIGLHTMASYKGEKLYLGAPKYDYSLLMNLASCPDSRQGGAVYGNYFFQFHNTNAVIQMYDLSTASLIQTFSLPAITNCHSSSGGFGFFYDTSDPLPLLYISGMNDRKIYVYRFTGSIGSLSIALHQTINLPSGSDLMYMPSVAIDKENRKMVLFGYTKNSWNSPTDNKSVIAYLNIPSNSGDITVDVNDVIGKSYMDFIWAEQSAFARLGKLYMAWGNTGESQGGGLYVIDYQEGIILSDINMVGVISAEPEALCLWGNTIILSTQSGIVYKLEF